MQLRLNELCPTSLASMTLQNTPRTQGRCIRDLNNLIDHTDSRNFVGQHRKTSDQDVLSIDYLCFPGIQTRVKFLAQQVQVGIPTKQPPISQTLSQFVEKWKRYEPVGYLSWYIRDLNQSIFAKITDISRWFPRDGMVLWATSKHAM